MSFLPEVARRLSVASLLLVAVTIGCQSSSDEERTPRDGPACTESTTAGAQVGDDVEDFALQDQSDHTVLLSDYCGKVIYIQFAAMWCPTCRSEAQKIQGYLDQFGADELIILNLIAETSEFEAPETQDLQAWANTFDISTPVLADPGWRIWDRYFETHATPRAMLIGKDGTIRLIDWVVDEEQLAETIGE